MSNIIFLDIDGVLNNELVFVSSPECQMDLGSVLLLEEAVAQIPQCKIVVSSSWRNIKGLGHFLSFVRDVKCVEFFDHLLPFLHEDYCTKKLRSGKRGEEVREWLSRHPEVIKYVCIDDNSDYFQEQPLLLTSMTSGFGYSEQELLLLFFDVSCVNHHKKEQTVFFQRKKIQQEIKILKKRQKFLEKYIEEGKTNG